MGHTTPALYEPTYTLNEYGLVNWVKPGRIDTSGQTPLVTVEGDDGKLYYARLFVRDDGLVYLRPGYEDQK